MKRKLLIATTNTGKLSEFQKFLSDLPLELVSLSDIGINFDIEEHGKTYEENSKEKALFFAKKSGLPALADDGGLEIDALGGEPGIKSRRWLGYTATDEELIAHLEKIANKLHDENRNARFVTVVTVALPNGKTWSVEADVKGIIAKKPLEKHMKGYPYRSFFYLPDIKKYYHESQLCEKEQTLYNHRYKAVQQLIPIIKRELDL